MRTKLLDQHAGLRTFVLVFDLGDEVVEGLQGFAEEERLVGSRLSAIGALRDVTLGWWSWETKEYERIRIDEQVEVLSLIGNVAGDPTGRPKVHAHVVVGRRDGRAYGGHLLEAHVRPTLEVTLIETPEPLRREIDEVTGLALIRP